MSSVILLVSLLTHNRASSGMGRFRRLSFTNTLLAISLVFNLQLYLLPRALIGCVRQHPNESTALVSNRLDIETQSRNISIRNLELQLSSSCECFNLVRETNANKKDVLAVRVQRWLNNTKALLLCPKRFKCITDESAVPKILHRIWECGEIPGRYESPIESWSKDTTDVVVFLWTEFLRREFVSEFLGPEKLFLYKRLIPGAYRADLFKYVVMYFIGGVYSDLDSYLMQDLTAFENLAAGITMAIDVNPVRLLPGALLMAPPKQQLFVCAMGEVFDHSEKRTYFGPDIDRSLDISGPGVLGECVGHILGVDDAIFKPGIVELASISFRLLHSTIVPETGTHVVRINNGTDLIVLQPGGASYEPQSAECDAGEHYSSLYRTKNIYRSEHEEGQE